MKPEKAQVQRRWRAGHTRHESRRGGGSSFQGAIGEGHRSSWRFSRTTVVDICTRTSPSRSSGPIVPDGAGTGRRAEGVRRSSGAIDKIARRNQQSCYRTHATRCDASSARSHIDGAPPVASACRRDGGREGRVPQEAREIFVCPFSGFDRGVRAECCIFQLPARDRSCLMATLIDHGGTQRPREHPRDFGWEGIWKHSAGSVRVEVVFFEGRSGVEAEVA